MASKGRRDNWNAIDPAFVVDRNDSLWMAWGSFWDGIQMAPLGMCDGRLQLAGYPRTIARRYYRNAPEGQENPTSRHAGVNAIEAPFILHHDGYYYLFVSWDYCCRGEKSTYRVVVGRSKEVYGPYVDREGRPMYAGGGTPVIAGDGTNFEAPAIVQPIISRRRNLCLPRLQHPTAWTEHPCATPHGVGGRMAQAQVAETPSDHRPKNGKNKPIALAMKHFLY